jgi:hypothetical protein
LSSNEYNVFRSRQRMQSSSMRSGAAPEDATAAAFLRFKRFRWNVVPTAPARLAPSDQRSKRPGALTRPGRETKHEKIEGVFELGQLLWGMSWSSTWMYCFDQSQKPSRPIRPRMRESPAISVMSVAPRNGTCDRW